MKTFSNIQGMIAHLGIMAAAETLTLRSGLKKCAAAIEKTAKEEIGVYQDAAGPFSAWAPLTPATQEQRVALGFTADDPLLRNGGLRDSISHQVDALVAVTGSESDVMVYQELGTDKIPPRAVIGPAAIRNHELILKTLGHAAAEGLLYGSGTTLTLLK